jgi:hypothetical protein
MNDITDEVYDSLERGLMHQTMLDILFSSIGGNLGKKVRRAIDTGLILQLSDMLNDTMEL